MRREPGSCFRSPQHLVYLVHVPLGVVVFHPQLVAVGLADGAGLVRPGVPDAAVQVVDVVGLLLPDPQKLVHRGLQKLPADGENGEFSAQVIPVDHPKELNGMGGSPVLPAGTDLPVGVPHSPGKNVLTVLNKDLIGVAHGGPS